MSRRFIFVFAHARVTSSHLFSCTAPLSPLQCSCKQPYTYNDIASSVHQVTNKHPSLKSRQIAGIYGKEKGIDVQGDSNITYNQMFNVKLITDRL